MTLFFFHLKSRNTITLGWRNYFIYYCPGETAHARDGGLIVSVHAYIGRRTCFSNLKSFRKPGVQATIGLSSSGTTTALIKCKALFGSEWIEGDLKGFKSLSTQIWIAGDLILFNPLQSPCIRTRPKMYCIIACMLVHVVIGPWGRAIFFRISN
jgi:hypothetical protein